MPYNILFTSLYAAGKDEPLRYYYVQAGPRRLYTDVMLTVEAATKYFLSTVPIDEIVILGRYQMSDAGDEERSLCVNDGKSFYSSDISELSTYSLLRYRLAQFSDNLKIEQEAIRETLTPEEQKEVKEVIREFYHDHDDGNEHRKFGRFFDQLVKDGDLYDELKQEVFEEIPAAREKEDIYIQWIKNYLYSSLKSTSKLEILEENENTKIRFFTAEADETGKLPLDTILKAMLNFHAEGIDCFNIYMALNNDDMSDNFLMLGILDILDTLYGDKLKVIKVCSSTNAHYRLAGIIREDTEGYDIAGLVSAVRTFLKYGKADMMVDCWEHCSSKNVQVDKMIYAMRRIDIGLSLCCIGDIEKGINDLRDLFIRGFDLENCDYQSKLFIMMAEGIKEDYGPLVCSEEARFIDLVKWAYRKSFSQQCLTLIEAKAPTDMVMRGMFYYCNGEAERAHVVNLFAKKRNDMKSSDYWQMDDIDHYFLKNYFWFKSANTTVENQRANAKHLMECLDNTNPDFLTGHTACDDRQALEDLLFAYLHVCRVRNQTNHANDGSSDAGTLFPSDKDISAKVIEISEAIRYFIESYDKVYENVKDKNPDVVRFTVQEVKNAARNLEREEKKY